MKKMTIMVLGPETPCWNCKTAERNVREAISSMDFPGVEFTVVHENIANDDIKQSFGSLRSPAILAGSHVLFQGEVPPADKVARKIRDLMALLD